MLTPRKIAIGVLFALVIILIGSLFGLWLKYSNNSLAKKDTHRLTTTYTTKYFRATTTTSSVYIKDCKPNPDVALISSSSVITFINRDYREHYLLFGKVPHSYRLPSFGEVNVKFDFYLAPGAYKYHCDNNINAGVISLAFPAKPE